MTAIHIANRIGRTMASLERKMIPIGIIAMQLDCGADSALQEKKWNFVGTSHRLPGRPSALRRTVSQILAEVSTQSC